MHALRRRPQEIRRAPRVRRLCQAQRTERALPDVQLAGEPHEQRDGRRGGRAEGDERHAPRQPVEQRAPPEEGERQEQLAPRPQPPTRAEREEEPEERERELTSREDAPAHEAG